jgi:hypothetical protein
MPAIILGTVGTRTGITISSRIDSIGTYGKVFIEDTSPKQRHNDEFKGGIQQNNKYSEKNQEPEYYHDPQHNDTNQP